MKVWIASNIISDTLTRKGYEHSHTSWRDFHSIEDWAERAEQFSFTVRFCERDPHWRVTKDITKDFASLDEFLEWVGLELPDARWHVFGMAWHDAWSDSLAKARRAP